MMLWLLPLNTMLYQITSFLLEVAAGLLSGVCLLRLYMQYQRIPMSARSGNPLGKFIFAFTDWLVLPLRKVVPAVGRWDMASLVAAFLVQLAQFAVLWALLGMGASVASVLVYSVKAVLAARASSARTDHETPYVALKPNETNF